ncbi:MAG: bifunctional adenosylcobinamide kinase/adenosylcobinamide-phosphate guanylyltransferase [Verrucomicrobiales bacterium]|nr:bifunctional adenosylcobinamide kinase/adenosylcobinamide-phosphate guanylyltransferase [Verrucomicrobiales bacterium]
MSILRFILGGSRSGKSAYGEKIAQQLAGDDAVIYIATCRSTEIDAQMQQRIQTHQQSRPAHWITVENQFDLIGLAEKYANQIILIDCLTLWLSHCSETDQDAQTTLNRLKKGLEAFKKKHAQLIIVSNELGSSLVPTSAASRDYRDLVGSANQLVASYADEVELIVAGLPLSLKTQS